MEIPLIAIGNSKGIRLSKTLLKKYQIKDSIELILKKGYIILKPKSQARKNWDKAFQKMHAKGDDQLLMDDVFADEDFGEWN